MHILRGPHVRHERHKPPVPPVRQHQARFLPHLAQQAVFGAFALLALAAYTDPLALVFVVGLFGAVQHQAAASLFDVAQRRILHCRPRAQKFPPFQPQLGVSAYLTYTRAGSMSSTASSSSQTRAVSAS